MSIPAADSSENRLELILALPVLLIGGKPAYL
jgi:hypothetical protein